MQFAAKTTCTAAIFSLNVKTLKLVSLLPVWKHRQEDSHKKQVKKTYYTTPILKPAHLTQNSTFLSRAVGLAISRLTELVNLINI